MTMVFPEKVPRIIQNWIMLLIIFTIESHDFGLQNQFRKPPFPMVKHQPRSVQVTVVSGAVDQVVSVEILTFHRPKNPRRDSNTQEVW